MQYERIAWPYYLIKEPGEAKHNLQIEPGWCLGTSLTYRFKQIPKTEGSRQRSTVNRQSIETIDNSQKRAGTGGGGKERRFRVGGRGKEADTVEVRER
jgi:hypothetical protein